MALALIWYAVDARRWFKGPKINVDHLIHTPTLEGSEGKSSFERQTEVFHEKKI